MYLKRGSNSYITGSFEKSFNLICDIPPKYEQVPLTNFSDDLVYMSLDILTISQTD
jgi:hypothetical protein